MCILLNSDATKYQVRDAVISLQRDAGESKHRQQKPAKAVGSRGEQSTRKRYEEKYVYLKGVTPLTCLVRMEKYKPTSAGRQDGSVIEYKKKLTSTKVIAKETYQG